MVIRKLTWILVLACGVSYGQDKSRVRIASSLPLTGPLAMAGIDFRDGVQYAMEVGLIAEKDVFSRLETVIEDSSGDGQKALAQMRKLLQARAADIILGPVTSSITTTMFREFEKSGKPLISATVGGDYLLRFSDSVFRSCISDSFQGKVLAHFVFQDLKKTKMALLREDSSEYSKSLTTGFEQEYVRIGGQIVASKTYAASSANFTAVLNDIKRANPQGVFMPSAPADAARAVEQARDVGLRVSFFGGDSWDTPDLFKGIHGDAAKGHYYLSQFSTSDPDPIVQEFVRGFRQRYNRSPGLLAAMGYDSISMIKEAVKRNKSGTAQGLIKSLQTLDQGSSLMGPVSVDPDRNLRKGAAILFTTASGQVFKARLTQQTASAATGG